MGVNESKDSDNGPFCVAIQDTPQSLTKFDVLEAVKEFEPLDATRVQENRWIVSLKTKNQAERAIQAGKIPLPKEECTIFITACDQDEIAGIRKGKQQKESNQDSQPGGPSVTSPDTGQEFAFKTGPPSVQTGVSTVSPTKEIPTGQQSPYQPSTVKTQHDHYYPAMHHPFNPEGMDTRPQTHENGPGQQYPYKPNPMNMDYSFYNPAIPPPMAPIGINMIPQRNLNPPGQQYPYEPNPMNTGYGRYQPIMPPAMYPLGVNMRPPRTQNPPGQQYPYEPNPMNTGYGRYQPVMQPRMDELGMNMRPPRTQNLPGQQWPCKPNPVNMEVMQPLMDPKGMITRPMRPMRNQNRPGQMYPYQPNPLKKESNTVVKPLMDSIGMNTRPQINANENEEMKVVNIDKHVQKYITYPERRNEIKDKFTKAAGSYRTQVQFFKVLQENIIGINGAAIKRIREETGTCIEFPSENSDSDVIIITGMKDNVEAARGKIEAIQEELKVSNCTAEIRAKPEYHKLLRKRGGYNIRNVSEKTGACVMFPHSQATDRDLISLIGSKDAVDKAKAELESLITSLDNMVEDEVSVDPKHQSYFVAGKNKVLRQIEDEYDLVYISFPNKEVTNGRVILKGESDCVEGAKKRILEIVSDMDAQVTIECVIPMQHHRTVMGAKGANVQEISSLYAVEIKFPKRPVNGDTNIPNEVNGGREDEEMSPKASDVIKITGQPENTEKAKTALLALVPVTVEVTVPFKFHGHIIGHKGGNIRKMTEEFNVTFSIPRSEESSDLIKVTGVLTNVRRATAALEQKVVSLEKAGEDRVYTSR